MGDIFNDSKMTIFGTFSTDMCTHPKIPQLKVQLVNVREQKPLQTRLCVNVTSMGDELFCLSRINCSNNSYILAKPEEIL